MTRRPARNSKSPDARPGKTSGPPQPPAGFRADPLRREAERGWAQSDESAAHGMQRRNKKARAQKLRRKVSRAKDDLIANLTERVTRLEAELAKLLKRRNDDHSTSR
jgi:hypothetical protein